MKTTVHLDDDIERDLKERARQSGTSFRALLNDTLRKGLQNEIHPSRTKGIKLPVFDMGQPRPGVNLDKALQLASDFEDEEILRKLQQRK